MQATTLMNWCHFDLDIMDTTGTITTTISEALGERLLSLTAEQIYESAVVQDCKTTRNGVYTMVSDIIQALPNQRSFTSRNVACNVECFFQDFKRLRNYLDYSTLAINNSGVEEILTMMMITREGTIESISETENWICRVIHISLDEQDDAIGVESSV
ncbi:uncharacterized protein LOC107842724 isoform X1 [Capsicum annuum]|uniref:uncharacterized protein LOC107842724 isoform X1 n=1 Tax=Capsicum annuum TaxID=4072 RepID=UPI001FB13E28|nr:uncharacterized protein LOC107842724 isoform X1 [Capsicum annuum]